MQPFTTQFRAAGFQKTKYRGRLGVGCVYGFAGLLKHRKIAEGDTGIFDGRCPPNHGEPTTQREPRNGLRAGPKIITPARYGWHQLWQGNQLPSTKERL